jgi:hypothetical protein
MNQRAKPDRLSDHMSGLQGVRLPSTTTLKG